jgi:hypothetical protein
MHTSDDTSVDVKTSLLNGHLLIDRHDLDTFVKECVTQDNAADTT